MINEEILYKEYDMILIDNTMYRVLDEPEHFMTLLRAFIPVSGCDGWVLQDYLFDLVMDCTLRTGEIFDKRDLVFHNGVFYNQGKIICDINDFKRDDIEFEDYDLLNGLTKEQQEYIFYRIYYSKEYNTIEYYVTDKVKLKIDR